MAQPLLDYRLSSGSIANPDGSFPIVFSGITVVPGPGATTIGQLDRALDLGDAGKAQISVNGLPIDNYRFSIGILFKAEWPVVGRENLVESDQLPFSMYLLPASVRGEILLVANVSPKAHGWNGPTTRFMRVPLKPGVWYRADLVYDNDTAGLFIDGEIVSVHAFRRATSS
jgi:hypothetical protein